MNLLDTAPAPQNAPPPTALADACWQQGLTLAARADWAAAAGAFGDAVAAAPQDLLYRLNLANAHRHRHDWAAAIEAAEACLRIAPEDPIALRLIGDCHTQLHRYAEAVAVFERLQATGAEEADAMVQHAGNLLALRRPREALPVLLRASALEPTQIQVHAMMATAFRDLALQKEAVECLRTVLALDPDNLQARSHLSYERRHICDWDGLAQDVEDLTQALVRGGPDAARMSSVFSLLSLPIDPSLLRDAARGEALLAAHGVQPLPALQPAACASSRLRLGLLSYDFHEHPVSQLLVELLEKLDRGRIELRLYSIGPDDGSALRARLRAAADAFVDLRGCSDGQAAERIRADGVELLVDLQGHTKGQRMGILARRPAPLQVAFLGFPGSTGAPFIDYLIGDPLVTPLALQPQYSERLAQMPRCFQPNGRWRPLPQPMARAQAGLPEDAFVMCAFNHTYKILPEAFDAWCAVMREVPRAVLWLKETNGQLHAHVAREAAARGVAAHRIVYARALPYADHFSRLALADVFVDTWPYNAHTTASDALWAGVPVVTVYGNSFASRVAASVLNAV
ncbi:MAG: tetratricopeptide repeat protein, partial [Burkholderiales bacterium]|nr:tetratricopeptide repeat protein [Burkholderiales bacterium]